MLVLKASRRGWNKKIREEEKSHLVVGDPGFKMNLLFFIGNKLFSQCDNIELEKNT